MAYEELDKQLSEASETHKDQDTKPHISPAVVRRLPRYYRYLRELLTQGVTRISSGELSARMNVTASQIRQDLNCFGGFGQQGYGYNVEQLYAAIGEILGLDKQYKTVIIGAGNLGRALANYAGFERRGFNLVGAFDVSDDIIGTMLNGVEVMHIDRADEMFPVLKPDIAILTIPQRYAAATAAKLARLGIKGIWNFTHAELNAPEGVYVEDAHLSDSLMTLSHHITSGK